jgi:hypothetical protein
MRGETKMTKQLYIIENDGTGGLILRAKKWYENQGPDIVLPASVIEAACNQSDNFLRNTYRRIRDLAGTGYAYDLDAIAAEANPPKQSIEYALGYTWLEWDQNGEWHAGAFDANSTARLKSRHQILLERPATKKDVEGYRIDMYNKMR